MLRFRRTEQPHTAYSTSAMETRDHSNGVSPKNQRSRGNQLIKNYELRIMRKLALFFVVAMLLNIASVFAQDCDYSGSIGTITWCLKNGTLTISGSGDISPHSWSSYSFHTLVIGSGITCIGSNTFANHTSLVNVVIEDSGTSLKLPQGSFYWDTFDACPIETLHLGRDLEPNDSPASPFAGKTSLTTLTIGDKVTNIGHYYFYGCGVIEVTIPNSLTTIGSSAFEMCEQLTTLKIGNKVKTIWGGAFQKCKFLKSVTIPKSVEQIGGSSFAGCTSLANVIIEDSGNSLKLPQGSFYWYTFDNCPITTLHLGRDLEPNDSPASPFAGNTSLTTLTIGDKVTNIGRNYFYGCSGLTQITSHPTKPPTIYDIYTFNGVNKGIPVKINCDYLTAYKAADHWKDFTNYKCMDDIIWDISDKTTSGNSVFAELTGNTLKIYGTGNMADFWYSGEPFNGQAPWYNENLHTTITKVIIQDNVTNIGDKAFIDCTNLTSIENWDKVKIIGKKSFENCNKLQTITIPNSVTEVEGYAFYNCIGLKSVTIGSNVKKIGEYAFYGCCNVEKIISLPTTPPKIESNTFGGCGKSIPNCTVYVCSTCIDNYKKTPGWDKFTDYKPIEVGITETDNNSSIQIYPNPTATEIFIQSELQIEKVEIFDMMGRNVETLRATSIVRQSDIGQSEIVLNIAHLPNGIYFVRIQTETGVVTRKVVKK